MISSGRENAMKKNNRSSGYSSLAKAGRGQRGSILVFLVVLMVIFAVLGVGMLSMFGSSLLGVFSPNSARRASYLAESGVRFTLSEVRRQTQLSARETALTGIDDGTVAGKWFNVTPGVARYQVRVYPYWSRPAAGVASTVINNAPVVNSGLPPDFSIPGIGSVAYLKVGANNRVGINSYVIAGDRKSITFNLSSPVTVQNGDYANFAFPTANSSQTITKGSAATPLLLNINAVTAIPRKNGQFIDDTTGEAYGYQTARLAGSTAQLEGVNWSAAGATATFPANRYLAFSQAARLDATGEYGGTQPIQKVRTDYLTLFTATAPGSPPTNLTPPALTAAASGFTGGDLSALDLTGSGGRVTPDGTSAARAVFGGLADAGNRFEDPEESGCMIGYHTAPISTAISDNLRNLWMQYRQLSYDVQVKMNWSVNLDYANQGITFRWQENKTCAAAVTCPLNNRYCCYEGYGVSFMRFSNKSTCSGDMIPNYVKPGTDILQGGKLLLVLWQQKINAGNVATKDWIAYAQLGDPTIEKDPATGQRSPADPDQKVTGKQGGADGRLNDNASIVVRVEDKVDTTGGVTTRYNAIKVFYGDASPSTFLNDSRTPDGIATNKQRARYYPQWLEAGHGGTLAAINPKWPSNQFGLNGASIAYWYNNLTSYDYFTLASTAPTTAYIPPVALIANSSPRAGFNTWTTLTDGCTIRTTDFTLDTFPSGRKEIGLFAMGNLNSVAGTTVAFDDFFIQILGGY